MVSSNSPSNRHYVYILKCGDGSLYTGYATDPVRRAGVHNSGKGAKYTRSRLPVTLVYQEEYATREEALQREREIKLLSRKAKLALVGLPAEG